MIEPETIEEYREQARNDYHELNQLRDRVRDLEAALRENVGDAYNLLTQGESPTQLRGPSARRIYDRSRAALAPAEKDEA